MKQLFLILTIVIFSITSSMAQMQKDQPKNGCKQEMQAHKGEQGKCIPNLTDEQIKKMEPLKLEFKKQKFDIQNQIKAKEAQLVVVSTGEKINKAEAYKLIDEISALKASLEKAKFDHRMQIRALLTSEQQLAFDMHIAKDGDNCGHNSSPQCGHEQKDNHGSCKPDNNKPNNCGEKDMHHGQKNCQHNK